jgi:hypothetical protein
MIIIRVKHRKVTERELCYFIQIVASITRSKRLVRFEKNNFKAGRKKLHFN